MRNKIQQILLAALSFFITYLSSAQTIQRKTTDSLGGHKVVNDASGKLLSWHQPSVPGAAYAYVSGLAAEFIKTGTPIDPKTGLPLYLVTCCFEGPHI
ncbi:MAG: hypothetical protein H0V91_01650, partial [Flavisolibacter sp.]|nr:hypothetical protein [Flavisolibacter sp.]